MDYLRAKILWDHLEKMSVGLGEVSREIGDGIAYALSVSQLDHKGGSSAPAFTGGICSSDLDCYGTRSPKLTQAATVALAESLDNTLNETAMYFYETEELGTEELHSRALRLAEDIKVCCNLQEADDKELVSQLDTVLDLHEEAVEVYTRLQSSLEDAMRRLPPLLNSNQTASNDLLALTIETSLLKLSVVRTRMEASLYGYTSSSNPHATMSRAVTNLHGKLTAWGHDLDTEERDLRTRLQDYRQLMELVKGQEGGFAQVVEDLATVRKETEDCLKDLRRLGWTDS